MNFQDDTSHNSSSSATALMNETGATVHPVTGKNKNTNDNDDEHQTMRENQTFVLPPEVWASVIECELMTLCSIFYCSVLCGWLYYLFGNYVCHVYRVIKYLTKYNELLHYFS